MSSQTPRHHDPVFDSEEEDSPSQSPNLPNEQSDEDGMYQDGDYEEEEEMGHMQEVIPKLWIGDIHAATDEEALKAAGITSIVTILRQKVTYPPNLKVLPIPIDDGPSTDILSHLPPSVEWIKKAVSGDEGGVLVHCQAGMSRSATVVAAYLMQTLEISPEEALMMIQEKRPVICPSETFQDQLQLYYQASCRVSRRDRGTRQWYMERTANQVMNQGEGPDDDELKMMAKYPYSPTPSNPPTPSGGHGRRKIRCKMCRRHLATREHMMDHILDQSPQSRPRTPSTSLYLPSPLSTLDEAGGSARPRAPSISTTAKAPIMTAEPQSTTSNAPSPEPTRRATEPIRKHLDANSLTSSLPPHLAALRNGAGGSPALGGTGSTFTSRSNSSSSISASITGNNLENSQAFPLPAPPGSVPPPSAPPSHLSHTTSSPSVLTAAPSLKSISEKDKMEELTPIPTKPVSVASLAKAGLLMTNNDSPDPAPTPTPPPAVGEGQKLAARRLSMLALTPADGESSSGPSSRRPSFGSDKSPMEGRVSPSIPTTGPPILVNPKCSGYFVEPLTWMEPLLASGSMQGKITCPNERCNAKIGSYDWAGIQCGCKEWVVPGFCIHRSKVDEVW